MVFIDFRNDLKLILIVFLRFSLVFAVWDGLGWNGDCPDEVGLSGRLRALSDAHGVDLALQCRQIRTRTFRLAVFDMDSTLIDCEVIDELAAAGRGC